MKVRKCGDMRKDFKIEVLERKIDVIDTILNTVCSNIIISLNNNKPVDLKDIKEQIREIQDFINN